EFLAIVNQLQAGVQVAVMPETPLDQLRPELDLLENLWVRLELNESAIRFLRLPAFVALEFAGFEGCFDKLAFPMTPHEECLGERIHRLGANTVQPDAELEYIVVILGARVDLGHAINHLPQRNPAPKIPHRHQRAFDVDMDLLAVAHDVFIDGI